MVPECTTSTTSPAGSAARPALARAIWSTKLSPPGGAIARPAISRTPGRHRQVRRRDRRGADRSMSRNPVRGNCTSLIGSSPRASAVSQVRRAGLQTANAFAGNRALRAANAAASLISAGASGPWMTPRGPSTGACRISHSLVSVPMRNYASRAASSTRIAVSATCSAPPSTSPVWPPICRCASHAIPIAHMQPPARSRAR